VYHEVTTYVEFGNTILFHSKQRKSDLTVHLIDICMSAWWNISRYSTSQLLHYTICCSYTSDNVHYSEGDSTQNRHEEYVIDVNYMES